MARKTKKQKIIAELRKKNSLIQATLPVIHNEIELSEKEPIKATPSLPQNASLYIYPIHLIKKDLTKTLLLSILAISLEIALFFILEKHISLPFKMKF